MVALGAGVGIRLIRMAVLADQRAERTEVRADRERELAAKERMGAVTKRTCLVEADARIANAAVGRDGGC